MTTDRELMQQALDALEYIHTETTADEDELIHAAIESLRARLAQPEEPDWSAAGFGKPPTHSEQWWKHEVSNAFANGYEKGRASIKQPEPEPVATVYDAYDATGIDWHCKDAPPTGTKLYTAPPQQPERKLWLWKNFVDGRPEYWAFDNPYPTNLDNGDPQTLGQPCGYAIFKPSRDGSRGRTEEQVLREMESVSARSGREWQGLTNEEVKAAWSQLWYDLGNGKFAASDDPARHTTIMFAKEIEAKLKEKNT